MPDVTDDVIVLTVEELNCYSTASIFGGIRSMSIECDP